ncbi:2-oxoacid:acceptor oxidoreductase family protein [Saccharibacillus sp. CPCC 101409]|uniref:2-oxoacid:acceptor oxidoreductase family protein n=1 Tax=Saccharibacillus sp. CPCC 101409 TaxID=3058041 RepID=UPI00267196CA|nr:2-oxoacid:acceptor oxidoreductase family protein [Saccharibacillus sp. CPCC 101409]MDO3410622.1 2-oxoacid:acceptor oxidoreductase family protein [Saccharibacillus sp. CPCC 101409]
MAILPEVNGLGFFEIRLESIGGLGANLAGKMLAEAGIVGAGMDGVSFSSYGSEKKGSPVKAHIRFCEMGTPIRDTSPIAHPHVIGIFHEALLKSGAASGVRPGGIVLVNSARGAQRLQEETGLAGCMIAVLDATRIAMEEKNKVNMAMLGGLFRLCGFLDPEFMKDVIAKSLGKKYPQAVELAVRAFERGYTEVEFLDVSGLPAAEAPVAANESVLGYLNQPAGGMVVTPGSTLLKDLSISRSGMLPAFDQASCINCAQCDTACPDLCFVWEEQPDKRGRMQMVLQGIDYQYCKGCLKCVEACPTDSLSRMLEQEGYAASHRVPQRFDFVNA